MGARDVVRLAVARELRPYVRVLALGVGAVFLALVVLPVSTAALIALSGGDAALVFGFVVVGLLGVLLVLAALPLAAVALVSLLGLATARAFGTYVTARRLRALRRVETLEEDRWWGPLLRPSAKLTFLDPRTPEERFEAELADAKSAYVDGDASEVELERRLDRLFGTGAGTRSPDASGTDRSGAPRDAEHDESGDSLTDWTER